MDCLEGMKQIDDNSIDIVITDPPYGVRKDVEDNIDKTEIQRFTMEWIALSRKKTESLITFFSNEHLNILFDVCRNIFDYQRILIWSKPKGSQLSGTGRNSFFYSYEPIVVFVSPYSPKSFEIAKEIKKIREQHKLSRGAVDIIVRGKKTGLCYRWEEGACLPTSKELEILSKEINIPIDLIDRINNIQREQTTEFDVIESRSTSNPLHPFQKPVDIIQKIIKAYTKENDIVLDPFCGTGTVGAVCRQFNRHFIGFEINSKYIDIANKRLKTIPEKLENWIDIK